MHLRGLASTAVAALVAAAVSVANGGTAAAEPLPRLTSAINDMRAASTCPPLAPDPLAVRSAELATQETSDYLSHRSSAVPFTDPLPALKTLGYPGNKAVLLSGHGENETDSIHGVVLEALSQVPDCSFTQYGVNASFEDGFVLTSVVLAGS